MAWPVKRIQADAEAVKELQRRARAATSTVREQERAAIVLLRLDGKGVETVAAKRVSMWCKRFEEKGLAGLEDKAGRGRRPSIPEEKVARVITEATRPPAGRSRWSVREPGPPCRHIPQHGAAHLGEKRAEAARYQDLQAFERSKVRGKVLGRDRALSGSAREGAGSVLRREKPVPGAGAHAAWTAAGAEEGVLNNV
jgi:hypothetical protein